MPSDVPLPLPPPPLSTPTPSPLDSGRIKDPLKDSGRLRALDAWGAKRDDPKSPASHRKALEDARKALEDPSKPPGTDPRQAPGGPGPPKT